MQHFRWRYIANKKQQITLVKLLWIIVIESILPIPSIIAALFIGNGIDEITGWCKTCDDFTQVSIPSQILTYSIVLLIPLFILYWLFFQMWVGDILATTIIRNKVLMSIFLLIFVVAFCLLAIQVYAYAFAY